MPDLRVARTAQLDQVTLAAARAVLDEAFDGDVTDDDWEHALGGTHVLVLERGELVGHGSLVRRGLAHAGHILATGYVEGVGVRPDRQGHGHGAAIMTVLERLVRRDYELGALSATAKATAFYARRGWQRWEGPTSVLTREGVRRTPEDDGAVFVLPVSVAVDLSGEITCDWRRGDVW